MSANDIQHGGSHYGEEKVQHWDFTWTHGYNQFEYSATKYVERCWLKNGVQDLRKALHHLQKYMEVGIFNHTGRRSADDMIRYLLRKELSTVQIVILCYIHIGEIELAIGMLDTYIENSE